MRKRTSGECYSDEALLALLDGELAPVQAQQIGQHLNACWPCRSRAEMLARNISELSALLDTRTIPPLAMERAAVLDRYFDEITVERVARDEGWARVATLPLVFPDIAQPTSQ